MGNHEDGYRIGIDNLVDLFADLSDSLEKKGEDGGERRED